MSAPKPSVRVLVLTGFGINCEEETAQAFEQAGAQSHIAHLNQVFNQNVKLQDFDLLALPGGFSFGDDLGSGKVMANKIKYKRLAQGQTLLDEIQAFLKQGKYIIGICNGFQMLTRLGLLPNIQGRFEQEVSLAANDSGQFQDRWVRCQTNPLSPKPASGFTPEIDLPIRHGEGKLIPKNAEIAEALIQQNLIFLRYIQGPDQKPHNPNGSFADCAGLCDPQGQVFGLMPHPEAYLQLENRPDWAWWQQQSPELSRPSLGLSFFEHLVQTLKQKQTLI